MSLQVTDQKPQTQVARQIIHGDFFANDPLLRLKAAEMIATPLSKMIEERNLYQNIQGKKYVTVEGWTTMGAMLGILPREKSVEEQKDGSYVAYVELYSVLTKDIIGGASSLCSVDERRWKTADKYARRSMAITRATGKAYRLGFSWIMKMANYEATPAEEMPVEYMEAEPVLKNPYKEAQPPVRRPSEAQRKRLFAIAKSSGWGEQEIKALMAERWQISSTNDLDLKMYEELCDHLQENRRE